MHACKTGTVTNQIDIPDKFLFDLVLIILNRRVCNAQMIPQGLRQILICLFCQSLLTLHLLLVSHLRNRRAVVYHIVF